MQAHAIVKDEVTSRQPKNIEYRVEYEPDMARMVKALRVLLDYNSAQARQTSEKSPKPAICAFEVITPGWSPNNKETAIISSASPLLSNKNSGL